jgi:FeS assembly SUF system protein
MEELKNETLSENSDSGKDETKKTDLLRNDIIEVLRTIFDPEIPVNIYEMGLIYEISITENLDVDIRMTLTSPMCPVAETLPPEVEAKAASVTGVGNVNLELVWDPPWDPSMMSEAARLELGM